METKKFEDQIKEQLQAREIAPSVGSWEQLSTRLDAQQKKKKPMIFWMGIAATIIGGILILSLVFNVNTPSKSPVIVDTPKQELNADKKLENSSEEIFIETEQEEQVVTSETTEELVAPKNRKTTSFAERREEIVVVDNKPLLNAQIDNSFENSKSHGILEATLNDALANVLSKTKNAGTITDAEVNRLLTEAASKISQERYKTDYAVGKVNPQDLLQDVEYEMDTSFRDKIFEILKEGYSKARTAVANRNY